MRADAAHAALRQDIVTWRLTPGAVLGEVEQAGRLGVSRTPVREALRRLAAEGLVVLGPGRTYRVAPLDPDDVTHLYELREALETQATRLAAARRRAGVFEDLAARFDDVEPLLAGTDRSGYYALVRALDDAVDEACANPHLRRSLRGVRVHAERVRRLSQVDDARLRRAAVEHAAIARAVADGDPVLAAQATAVHLRAGLAAVLAAVGTPPVPAAVATAGPAAAPAEPPVEPGGPTP